MVSLKTETKVQVEMAQNLGVAPTSMLMYLQNMANSCNMNTSLGPHPGVLQDNDSETHRLQRNGE